MLDYQLSNHEFKKKKLSSHAKSHTCKTHTRTHTYIYIYAYIDEIDRMITWTVSQINGTFHEDTIQRTFECRA